MGSDWPLGSVELKVLDLEREIDFYERFGLTRILDGPDTVTLGAGGSPLLRLRALPGGRDRPRRTAGLYHFAVLLPREEELGGFLRRSLEERLPLTGTADHFVSQALYFDDPEGYGTAPVEAGVRGLHSFEVRRLDRGRTDPNGIEVTPAA